MNNLGNKEIFSKNLRYYMTIHNKTRNDICKDLDFKYTTFTDWYNGNTYPGIDRIEKLANYFMIEKSDLIECRDKNISIENKQVFPLVGTVKAGYNYLAQENLIGYVATDKELSDPENYFALKVTGNSMQPVLYEDDIVIVHKQNDVESGQVGIILVDNEEATIKRIIKHEDYIELIAFNSYYPPRKLDKKFKFKIIGKVVEARISKIFV